MTMTISVWAHVAKNVECMIDDDRVSAMYSNYMYGFLLPYM